MESVENLKQQTFLPTNLIRMCNIYVYMHVCRHIPYMPILCQHFCVNLSAGMV